MLQLDFIVLAVFALLIFGIGLAFTRIGSKSSQAFFEAGGATPWWINGLSLFISYFSAGTFVVWGSIAYKQGIVANTIQLTMAISGCIVALFIARRWKRTGARTAAEYIGRRFNVRTQQFYTYMVLLLSLFMTASVLYPVGKMVHVATPFSLNTCIVLIGLIIVLYTAAGGLWAVLVTDVVQFVILTASVLIVIPIAFDHIGGAANLLKHAPPGFFKPLNEEYTFPFMLAFIVYQTVYIGGNWSYVQRYTSVENERESARVSWLFTILYFVSPFIWMIPPMVYRIINPGLAGLGAEGAYMMLCKQVLPAGLIGLVLAGMISATSSKANTTINLAATVFATDLYKKLIRPGAADKEQILVARLFTLAFGAGTVLIALLVPRIGGIVDFVLSIASIAGGALFTPIIWSLFSRRQTANSVVTVTIVTLVINLFLKIVAPAWLDMRLNRTWETIVGQTIPLLLLFCFEMYYLARGRAAMPEPIVFSPRSAADTLVGREETARQNRFGIRVIAAAMTMVGVGILVLGWLASVASLTVMIVGASIIVCAGLIGLLTARRLKVTQGINGLLLILFMMSWQYAHAQEDMSAMWKGESHVKQSDSLRGAIFREGRYAMFVHWGYYSLLANRWEGKTYYGIGEWLMNKNMAGISVEAYKKNVGDFNPTGFNADSIVELAKRAGMKYIVITSKHHDGFAMFHSKYSRFNIFDATPFKRDPMKEMAVACHNAGLGLGFYYSQTQDWTTVGGHAGAVSFDDYFHHRCLPEVEQLTTEYGPIALVWFDTPGNIRKEYAQALVDMVHKNQPAAFVSGRVGHGLGDYSTLGDMEIPRQNIGGLWETVEVTNDGWGYSWYDENWKTPQQVLHMLLSTIARGGNFMLNIGPKGDGTVPAVPKAVLLRAGQWIQQHPDLVYQGERSPWQHAMPWGDAIVQKNKLSLVIFNWPPSGKLYVPGLRSRVVSVQMLIKGQVQPLPFSKQEGWLVIQTPEKAPEPLVQVIELECDGRPNADSTLAIDPEQTTNLDVLFAGTGGGAILKGDHWMEKFGEWKNAKRIVNWTAEGKASWTVDVVQPGYYQASLQYKGDSRLVWKIEVNPGTAIQNNQNATNAYAWYPIGWLQFTRPGRYSLSVSLVEGNGNTASLAAMRLQPINF